MYSRILVSLDGSELAEVALPYAEELAGKLGSAITLLNVAESARHRSDRWHQFYMEKMAEATAKAAKRHRKKGDGNEINVSYDIVVGNPAQEIVDHAERDNASLIIMATHGWSGVERWEIGSVADKVVRAARQPVVLIRVKGARPDVREEGIVRRVLVPLDGSSESEAVVPYIEDLALSLKSKVVLFQVVEQGYRVATTGDGAIPIPYSPEEMQIVVDNARACLDKIAESLGEKGINSKSEVRIGEAAEEIIGAATEMSVDLVAMGTHGRSGVRRWAFGSVAAKVLEAGTTPLLLVRAKGTPAHD